MIGDLRRRVSLFSPEHTPDGAGGYVQTWAVAGECWAQITPLGGTETVAADRLESPAARFRVGLRAPNPVRTDWRLLWRERWHRIESLQTGERAGDLIQLIIAEIAT